MLNTILLLIILLVCLRTATYLISKEDVPYTVSLDTVLYIVDRTPSKYQYFKRDMIIMWAYDTEYISKNDAIHLLGGSLYFVKAYNKYYELLETFNGGKMEE
jgi:hypothetical protein